MRHTVLVIPESGEEVRHVDGPAPARATMRWGGRSLLSASAAEVGADEIVWSGSFAEVDGGEIFDEDPRTWGAKGWDALRERVERCERGVVLRPHARHVVSDVPGCRRLLESAWAVERGVRLCYDPASMMTEQMWERGEDHLRRMYEAIELFPVERVGMVVVGGGDVEMRKRAVRLAMEWVPEVVVIGVMEGEEGEVVGEMKKVGA